jgi:flagellar biosynthesis/type III secretory pathway protein FliH
MAQAVDDVYFMVMTGVWKMADLEDWAVARSEEAVDEAREEIEKEAYDEGHADGYKEAIKDAQKAVEDLI